MRLKLSETNLGKTARLVQINEVLFETVINNFRLVII